MPKKHTFNALILGDLHINLPFSEYQKAVSLIKALAGSCEKLILLGDVFCYFNPHSITERQQKFLSFLKKCAQERKFEQIVWLVGNHDYKLLQHSRMFPLFYIQERYYWRVGKESFLALHGHQLKGFIFNQGTISELLDIIERSSWGNSHWGKRMRQQLKRLYLRIFQPARRIAREAVKLAKQERVNNIICGHTHQPMVINEKGIRFINCGAFDDDSNMMCMLLSKNGSVMFLYL